MNQIGYLRTLDNFRISIALTRGSRSDIVIWSHGITVDKDEYLEFFRDGADSLMESGLGSLRFDFRGHGVSTGTSLDFSIIGQNLDVEAVIRFATGRCGASRLHLVGASFGAPPAIFAAARHPNLIQTLALIAPVLSYQRTFLEPETEWTQDIFAKKHLKQLEKTGKLFIDEDFCIGIRLVEEMRVLRPDLALRELHQPVLVVHGDSDSMVPYEASRDACQGLEHVELVTMNGMDHGYIAEGDDEGVSDISIANKEQIFWHLRRHFGC